MLCLWCQCTIQNEHIDSEAGTAECRRCDRTFLIDLSPTQPLRSSALTIDHDQKTIQWRWIHFWYAWGIPFTLLGMASVVVWYSGVFSGWISSPPEEHAMLYLGGLIPLVIALYCVYTTVAGLVNVSVIQVDASNLIKKHSPLPWFYTYEVECSRIVRTMCEQKIRENDGMEFVFYTLSLVVEAEGEVPLIHDRFFSHADRPLLQNKEAMLAIKRQLDDWLGLPRVSDGTA
jgi:hypothetical protein